ncbi:MAG: EAL domain-containing protein [Hyphomicrobiaceae bacterium]|nr:EAL domain-containing protein [Hyphomicrobiaceae bacterium]
MTQRLDAIQKDVLTAIALGQSLESTMLHLCERVEALSSNVMCSILRIDEGGRLRTLAAPSLPEAYCRAVDGTEIGPVVGSCGTAAYYCRPVEVLDIESDPLWANFKDLALRNGLKACWSSPIVSVGRVVGTFAFYATECRSPTDFERNIVTACVDLCAIAISVADSRDRINKLAYTDHLTGLGNRAALRDKADAILADAAQQERDVCLFYLDLDGFKAINDLHSHGAGDRVLREVAARLSALASDADIVVRLGGDEFVVLIQSDGTPLLYERLARILCDGISGRYTIKEGTDAGLGVSIGIARFPQDGKNVDDLLAYADNALYKAKAQATTKYVFFDASMRKDQLQRRALERDISHALELGQLHIAYQPIINARRGKLAGFEALLRWTHPIRGNIPPSDFIAAAEACGAINELGRFALREACKEASRWPAPLRVAVNVSPAQIATNEFARVVEAVLAETLLRPERLELEVTESVFISDPDSAFHTLQHLKKMGISIALDDFGTGYSSLSTLRSFPFDRLKIDRQFVAGMTQNPDDAAIVRSVMALAHSMKMEAVAEGVETEEQKTLLGLMGCDFLQGYLFGKPERFAVYDALTQIVTATAAARYHPPSIPRQ